MTTHENYRIFPSELLLKELKIGEHMQAIDAAVGPKIDKDELVAQVTVHGKWRRVEPSVIVGELLRAHLVELLGG